MNMTAVRDRNGKQIRVGDFVFVRRDQPSVRVTGFRSLPSGKGAIVLYEAGGGVDWCFDIGVVVDTTKGNVMKNEVIMEIDLRKHPGVREAVHGGLKALLVQGRQIWEGAPPMGALPKRHTLDEIVVRLMVGVGDLSRIVREGPAAISESSGAVAKTMRTELKKELGNILFSTVRWIDDLGLDPLECLELAIEAQEKFAASGRPR